MADEVGKDAAFVAVTRTKALRTIGTGAVAMDVASLPCCLVQGQQQILTFGIQKGERPIVTQGKMTVHDVQQPPCAPALLTMFFRYRWAAVWILLVLTDTVQARSGWVGIIKDRTSRRACPATKRIAQGRARSIGLAIRHIWHDLDLLVQFQLSGHSKCRMPPVQRGSAKLEMESERLCTSKFPNRTHHRMLAAFCSLDEMIDAT